MKIKYLTSFLNKNVFRLITANVFTSGEGQLGLPWLKLSLCIGSKIKAGHFSIANTKEASFLFNPVSSSKTIAQILMSISLFSST
jgi:hypothetical protein